MSNSLPVPAAKSKMDCFEAVRGLAAVGVLIGHLILVFCPALYFRADHRFQELPSWLRAFAHFPGKFLWNGQLHVEIFFVLSGFVLSLAYFRKGSIVGLTSGALRRYPRLMIPVFAAVMLAFVLLQSGLMFNRDAANLMDTIQGLQANPGAATDCSNNWLRSLFAFETAAGEAVREGAYGAFFESPKYVPVLWTMPVELAGSFLVYAGLALCGGLRRRWLVYALGAGLLALLHHRFLVDFIIGIALCDLYVTNENAWRRTLGLGVALAVITIALFVIPWKPVSAALIVAAVAASPRLQQILSARWLAWLGRISFGLYLIHMPILCALSCGLFVWLYPDVGYVPAALLASAVGLAAVFVGSWLFCVLVDSPAIAIAKWFESMVAGVPASEPVEGSVVVTGARIAVPQTVAQQ